MNTMNPPRVFKAAGLEIDLRRLDLPDNLNTLHGPLLDRAVAQLHEIESGEPINTDENRPVGHYWLRNPELAPADESASIRKSWQCLEQFAVEHFSGASQRFDAVLWVGIGGSSLGPQMIHQALRGDGPRPKMFFFDNTDPAGFRRTLGEISNCGGPAKTLVVIVSKSGGTKETANGMLAAQQAFAAAGLPFESHAVAVTVKGSQLYRAAVSWLETFEIWDWVGGRTSIFSAVGLLPTIVDGLPWRELLDGARAMDDCTRDRSLSENAALSLALAWHHLVGTRGLRNMAVIPYCDQLELMARYLQQLVMESLGKSRQGITVYGNKGSTDQHSFVQQLREGIPDFFVNFIRVIKPGVADFDVGSGRTAGDYLAAFQEGTARALADAGRPSLRITMESVTPFSLGALVALYERTVGFYAALIGVNAYFQPGVEAGKRAADMILRVQDALLDRLSRCKTRQSVGELAKAVGSDIELVYDILTRLALLEHRGVRQIEVGDLPAACIFMGK